MKNLEHQHTYRLDEKIRVIFATNPHGFNQPCVFALFGDGLGDDVQMTLFATSRYRFDELRIAIRFEFGLGRFIECGLDERFGDASQKHALTGMVSEYEVFHNIISDLIDTDND